jgi:hypothetical protein
LWQALDVLVIITLDLSDDEKAALAQLLRRTIDENRYALSPRPAPMRAILAKLEPPKPRPELPPPLKVLAAFPSVIDRPLFPSAPPDPRPIVKAGVRLIVWCRDCGRQVDSDPAEMARQYGSEKAVPDLAQAACVLRLR